MPQKILIVDDDVELCRELAEILTQEGHSVETVSDGKTCEESIRKNTYDVIILDYRMPGMDGIQLLKANRNACLRSRVYIATGRPFIEKLLENEKLSGLVAGVLSKPYDVEALLSKINRT
jgi:DNA-binding response OmpR family regulator